jgi:lysophospholipase L1-like esterase
MFKVLLLNLALSIGVTAIKPVTHPSGLSVVCDGRTVIVQPGEFYVNDSPVKVFEPVVFNIDYNPIFSVEEDLVNDKVTDRVERWVQGIDKCSAVANPKFNKAILMKGTLTTYKDTKSSPKRSNDAMLPEQAIDDSALKLADTRFDELLGLDVAALTTAGKNKIGYKANTYRIDTVVLENSGKFSLLKGAPATFAPNPPAVPAGSTPMFNVLIEPGLLPLKPKDLVPITASGPISVEKKNRAVMKPFTDAVAQGRPVRIVFFGDSITCGGFAYDPAASFPNRFLSRLHQAYPKSQIGFVNMGIGGSNSTQRMPDFDKAIEQKPDLMIVEFVNDFKLPASEVEANYSSMVRKAKAAGTTLLVCTPHLPLPSYLNMKSWTEVSRSHLPRYIRSLAQKENIAIADVSMRWENLKAEGLPPEELLTDGILHPNEYGHEIYAQELSACLNLPL